MWAALKSCEAPPLKTGDLFSLQIGDTNWWTLLYNEDNVRHIDEEKSNKQGLSVLPDSLLTELFHERPTMTVFLSSLKRIP